MLLKNKVVVITGGSRGIGAGCAIKMAQEGAKVLVNYSGSKAEAEDVVDQIIKDGGEAIPVKANVTNKQEVDNMMKLAVDTYGSLDVLVSNAGICPMTEWFDMTEEIWDKTFDINMKGTYLATHAASKIMADQGKGGSIIGMSSISALVGGALQTHYCPTKSGIKSLMQSLAIVLGPHNIRCNSILAGCILTDINKEQFAEDKELINYFKKRIPLKGPGLPDDIAGVAVFLASDLSKYVNGAEILTDGGLFVNLQ